MRTRLASLLIVVAAGCGKANPNAKDMHVGPHVDMATVEDMAGAGGGDMTTGADMTSAADMATPLVALSTSALTFAPACPTAASYTANGTIQAQTQSFTITNNTNKDLSWTAAFAASPSPFSLPGGNSGTVKAGMTSSAIVIQPAPINLPANTAANAYGDTLTITTGVTGDPMHVITLTQTAQGAVLSFNPTSINFGTVPVTNPTATTALQMFQVVNAGSAAAKTVTLTVASSGSANAVYQVNGGSSAMLSNVGAGMMPSVTTTYSPGTMSTDGVPSTATVTMTVDGTTQICAPLPSPLQEAGTGTLGSISTSSLNVYFTGSAASQNGTSFPAPPQGNTYCGTTAGNQTITISNTGNTAVTVGTATFGQAGATPYSFVNGTPAGMTIAAGASLMIPIASSQVPASYDFTSGGAKNYNDTLTITTNATGDSPHVFNLIQSAYGAQISSFFPAPNGAGLVTLAFPDTAAGSTSVIQMNVTNDGTMPANMLVTNVNNSVYTFEGENQKPPVRVVAAPNGAVTNWNAFFSPTAVMGYAGGTADLTLPNTWLCGPAPQDPVKSFAMSGTGTAAANYSVTPTSISFKDIPCGQTTTQKATVTIKNTTASAVPFTATVQNATNGATFNLSAASGTVPAGSVGTPGVTTFDVSAYEPPTVTQASGNLNTSFTANLQVVVNGTATFDIPISETSSGLILSFVRTTLTSTDPANGRPPTTQGDKLVNNGNISGSVTLTLENVTGTGVALGINGLGTTTYTSTIAAFSQGGATTGVPFLVVNSSSSTATGSADIKAAGTTAAVPVCQTPTNISITVQP